MSSRRSSAIATAEASLQGSRSGSPNEHIQIDTSMTDLTNIEEEEESKSGSTSSYIQRSPQLDIAFLHSISTHRPLGPHKHFNVIPVLITLDRTIRQIGARMRDASTSEPLEDVEEEKNSEIEEESSSKRKRNDRSPSTSKKVIKKEDLDEDILLDAAYAATTSAIPVNGEMVWQRLSELYDLEGLEELEDGAVDGEDDSPFYTSPPPTYFSIATRKVLGEKIKSKPVFGFGSSLIKLPESATPTPTKSSGRQQKQSRSKAAQHEEEDDEEEDDDDDEQIADFELGPWEEFEDLIAPRRLKSYAPDEGQSESDEELSEPSAETKVAVGTRDEDEDDIEAKEEDEDEESEDDEEDGDEDEDEEDEEDEEEEEEEKEEKKPSKRKGASSSKRAPANSRRKSGTASATPTASASTRTSRSSAKPRRSARR